MKTIITILSTIILLNSNGQSSIEFETCSINVIREVSKVPSENTVLRFISTYNEDCKSNVEFTQTANWMLFYLLEFHPQLIISTLFKAETTLGFKIDHIIENFKSPVTDDIDLRKIFLIVEKQPTSDLQKRILDKLKFKLKH